MLLPLLFILHCRKAADSARQASTGTISDRKRKAKRVEVIARVFLPLDEHSADSDALPDLVKIDVEWAEARVLAGMRRLVERCPPTLFVEIRPKELVDFGSSASGVDSTLIESGYEVYEIEEMRRSGNASVLSPLDRGARLTRNTMLLGKRRDSC